MEKALFIVNPSSGSKEALNVEEELLEVLGETNFEVQRYETTGEDDFTRLTKEAMQKGFLKVFVLGGDGTISEYVRAVSSLIDRPEIILIPLGTTNNFARALNTELNTDALISQIQAGDLVAKQADVGQIDEDYFISTLSAGSIPEMVWKTDDERKEDLGPFAYILEGISALNERESFDLKLITDSQEVDLNNITLLVIGLSNSVFGIPIFFEEAKIDDGKFHLYALKNSDMLRSTASLASDVFMSSIKEKESDIAYVTSFSEGKIETDKAMNLAMDGEKGPAFPVDLKILPRHLTFLVPEAEN